MSPTGSLRWCPTPEQLMILEEMYRGGKRTPNASQIQQITAHLSFYGKIEGKNVFYWFQNHKARDRQKARRKLMGKQMHQQHVLYNQHQHQHQHHLLHYLEAPPACVLPPLSYYSPVGFLPQVGVEEASSTQMMSYYTRNVDHRLHQERCEMEKSMARSCGRDWTMMLEVGPTPPCCNRPSKPRSSRPPLPTTNPNPNPNPIPLSIYLPPLGTPTRSSLSIIVLIFQCILSYTIIF